MGAPAFVAPLAAPEPLADLGPPAGHEEMFHEDRPLGQVHAIDDPVRTLLDDGEPALAPPIVEAEPVGPQQGPQPVGADPPADISRPLPAPARMLEQAIRRVQPFCPLEQPAQPFAARQPFAHCRPWGAHVFRALPVPTLLRGRASCGGFGHAAGINQGSRLAPLTASTNAADQAATE